MEMYSEVNIVFIPANTTSFLQPMDQGVILIFKAYDLRNTLCKSLAAIDRESCDGSGQSKLETPWEGVTIPDAIKNLCDMPCQVAQLIRVLS